MIILKNVSFKYDTREKNESGIYNINLDIKKGECVVLCGTSGSGKTTLTRIINGLAPNFYNGELTGEIGVNSIDIRKIKLSDISSLVGSVFQNPKSQFFNVDTTSELAFGCENLSYSPDKIRERVLEVIETFNIKKLVGRSIFELSGGEKQKIACASVYSTLPEVFVLDEPSSNLDANSIKLLSEIIEKLKELGKTIIIAEHRMFFLKNLADRYIYMEKGKIKSEFSNEEFRSLSKEDLINLGLRSHTIEELEFKKENKILEEKIELSDIYCEYDKNTVLSIPKLTMNKGEIIAIIGKNGAGKSTFANCLSGIAKSKGDISINGKKLKNKERIKKSFMVMQDVNNQLFTENVFEEITLNMQENSKHNPKNIIKQLDLEHLENQHPMTLSGGEKQRVAIASSICADKEILIFDEPTSGLDYKSMKNISKIILDIKEEVFLSVIITHDIELIFSCCTSVIEMEEGRIKNQYDLNEEGIKKLKEYFFNSL